MTFKTRLGGLLAAAILAFSGAAAAQADDREALARQLADQTGASRAALDMIEIMVPMMRQQIQAGAPNLTDAQLDEILSILTEEFEASESELRDGIVALYAREFTEEELRAATEFYDTEIGRAFVSRMPQVMQEAAVLGESWGMQVAQRALPRVQAYMQENQ